MTSTIAIVGGAGQIARLLTPILTREGHTVVPLVRREAQAAELRGPGVEPRMLDIETSGEEAFAAAFDGVDAVVFAAGGGPDGNIERKRTVDLQGALKSVAGSRAAGVRRYVQVSAIGVDDPLPPDVGEVWAAYVAAKRDSDAAVRASDLDWTIIRPGGLTDEPGTGRVALAPELPRGQVPRADVAAVIAEVLASRGSIGKQWTLVGGDVPVARAVAQAAGA
ncbi:SDR family oxidoreductase [Serinibacter salmoneus]|uniref:Putative NAD(P)-binding protein n=1 Tax=Serinibacter salmoneus TaxID=556530 RepID=A0A2A9D3U8_9MICO|nr:SDR family oxidoreductase [Serinibacter salmoneus]PFG20632.1 putative NAD(P)-binding protein [Serinibacter salmoneus]